MKNNTNIVLIGFMGCGKSSVGIDLAKRISYSFVDSDLEIEKEIGMSISEYFKKYGEEQFRILEEKTIKRLVRTTRQVIATGGGIVKNPVNINHLKKTGHIVYLKASAKHIYNNIKNDSSRPLLNVEDKYNTIIALLNERKELYEKHPDFIVEVDGKSIEEISSLIINYLEEGQLL
ncbi:MAG: shikimate kinase [Epulopiscium sp.]|jgi:shikimate kinase|nr:shikimate kinase [Candidatus Epulonipiscium sp.]